MRKICVLALVSVVFFNASCDTVNSYLIKNDIEAVFAKNGLKVELLNCESQMRSRSGSCELKLSAEEVNSVVENLKLVSVENDDKYRTTASKFSKCTEMFGDLSSTKIFSGTRAEIGNGGVFSYVNLFVHPQNSFGCLEVVYAYG
jgi:hypothetical protein